MPGWVHGFCVFFLFGLIVLPCRAQDRDTLQVGIEGVYAPFTPVEEGKPPSTFDRELAALLCEAMEAECAVRLAGWDELMAGLRNGRFDMIIAAVSLSDAPGEGIDFLDYYYPNELTFVGRKETQFVLATAGIEGERVGVQAGTSARRWLEENHPDIDIGIYDTLSDAYRDLAAGMLSAVFTDRLANETWLSTPEGAGSELKGEAVLAEERIAIGIRNGEVRLMEDLNEALEELQDGEGYQPIQPDQPFSPQPLSPPSLLPMSIPL